MNKNQAALMAFTTVMAFLLMPAGLLAVQPELRFHKDGTFKIMQLADMHIRSFNKTESDAVYARIRYAAETERPDLIVLTGDNITARPAEKEIKRLTGALDSLKIPWIAMYGNHDEQQDLTRPQMSELYVAGKYSLNTLNEAGELSDRELTVLSSDGKEKSFYIFCMDSHSYSKVLGYETYDWFTTKQVEWLRECCKSRTSADGSVAPSFAFFHIPLREYIDACEQYANPRENSNPGGIYSGIRGESICCGGLNTGMFDAMCETGSVIGVSVGHDHDNDFVAVYNGIALCYGRYSGSNTVYNHLPQGVRFFVLNEDEKGFETWIREDNDRVVRHIKFDGEKIRSAARDRGKPFGTWHNFE